MTIALFNPSIASSNLGDQIIIDAVQEILGELFPREQIVHLPTQEKISSISKAIANRAQYRIVGGTNLLSSKMLRYRQWKLNYLDAIQLDATILLGVGWWQYQSSPDFYSRSLLHRVLSKSALHSVRDRYTLEMLGRIGYQNVTNTGCPTMWGLTPLHCSSIEASKAESVVFTLTDYHKDPVNDRMLFGLLQSLYRRVCFWPQGSGDRQYLADLGVADVEILSPSVDAFNKVLASRIDYVGTRLHAGIRALQRKQRALILAVDNRAPEIARDTDLAVLARYDQAGIKNWICSPAEVKLRIDWESIKIWKSQFKQ